jgi:hypothetical protein
LSNYLCPSQTELRKPHFTQNFILNVSLG